MLLEPQVLHHTSALGQALMQPLPGHQARNCGNVLVAVHMGQTTVASIHPRLLPCTRPGPTQVQPGLHLLNKVYIRNIGLLNPGIEWPTLWQQLGPSFGCSQCTFSWPGLQSTHKRKAADTLVANKLSVLCHVGADQSTSSPVPVL